MINANELNCNSICNNHCSPSSKGRQPLHNHQLNIMSKHVFTANVSRSSQIWHLDTTNKVNSLFYQRWSNVRKDKLSCTKRKHLRTPHSREPSNRAGSHAVGATCKWHLAAILSMRPSVESQTAEASSHDAVHVRSCCFSAQLDRRSMTLQYWGLTPPPLPPPPGAPELDPGRRRRANGMPCREIRGLSVARLSAGVVGCSARTTGVIGRLVTRQTCWATKKGQKVEEKLSEAPPESTSYVLQWWAHEVEGIKIIPTGLPRATLHPFIFFPHLFLSSGPTFANIHYLFG